ncbi:MAG TPA: hypothetical protein VE777_19335 [Gaiellales bacterium]|jgi:hypothetical protein|nr:hypothetical protein [Gaiellales bacterium]
MRVWFLLPLAFAAFAIGLRPGPWRLEPRDEEADWWEAERAAERLDELRWKVAEARYKLWALTMRLSAPRSGIRWRD